jgi:hypothetical protein
LGLQPQRPTSASRHQRSSVLQGPRKPRPIFVAWSAPIGLISHVLGPMPVMLRFDLYGLEGEESREGLADVHHETIANHLAFAPTDQRYVIDRYS